MTGITKRHSWKRQARQKHGKMIPVSDPRERDGRHVNSKLFIILAAESHLRVAVQMEQT